MNPFQRVYDELWKLVEQNDRLGRYIRPGNRINFGKATREFLKKRVSDGDFPQLILIPATGTGNQWFSSSSTEITKQYSWMVTTGDLRTEKLFEIEWGLLVAMHGWAEQLTKLTYEGRTFVKSAKTINFNDSLFSELTEQLSTIGWSALWTCEVRMYFSIVDILNERKK